MEVIANFRPIRLYMLAIFGAMAALSLIIFPAIIVYSGNSLSIMAIPMAIIFYIKIYSYAIYLFKIIGMAIYGDKRYVYIKSNKLIILCESYASIDICEIRKIIIKKGEENISFDIGQSKSPVIITKWSVEGIDNILRRLRENLFLREDIVEYR